MSEEEGTNRYTNALLTNIRQVLVANQESLSVAKTTAEEVVRQEKEAGGRRLSDAIRPLDEQSKRDAQMMSRLDDDARDLQLQVDTTRLVFKLVRTRQEMIGNAKRGKPVDSWACVSFTTRQPAALYSELSVRLKDCSGDKLSYLAELVEPYLPSDVSLGVDELEDGTLKFRVSVPLVESLPADDDTQ